MIRWLISAALAYVMLRGLDWVLPASMSRIHVLTIGGVTALMWSCLDDFIRQPNVNRPSGDHK